MFPLRDENPTQLTPIVTIVVLLANVVVWVYVQGAGMSETVLGQTVCAFGMIPAEITGATGAYEGIQLAPGLPPCAFGGLTLAGAFTSMFLHGSWVHLIANMWFLWLFGKRHSVGTTLIRATSRSRRSSSTGVWGKTSTGSWRIRMRSYFRCRSWEGNRKQDGAFAEGAF